MAQRNPSPRGTVSFEGVPQSHGCSSLVTWPSRKLSTSHPISVRSASPPFTSVAIIFRPDVYCVWILGAFYYFFFFFFRIGRGTTAVADRVHDRFVTRNRLKFLFPRKCHAYETVYISVCLRHPVLNCLFGRERIDYGAVSD